MYIYTSLSFIGMYIDACIYIIWQIVRVMAKSENKNRTYFSYYCVGVD